MVLNKHKLLSVITIVWLVAMSTGCEMKKTYTASQRSLEYVSMWEKGEGQAIYLDKMAKKFEKETGIKVHIQFGNRDILTKIKGRIIVGDSPDIIEHGFYALGIAMKYGGITATDLTDMFYNEKGPEGQNRLVDIYGQPQMDLYKIDGKLLMFPYERVHIGFFYNKKLYRDLGLKVPNTYDEFLVNCQILKQEGYSPLALDSNIYGYDVYYYLEFIKQLLGTDAVRKLYENRNAGVFNNKAYLIAAQKVTQLSPKGKDYFQKDYKNTQWPNAQVNWSMGKYGHILGYTWIPSETIPYAGKDFEYGYFTFPKIVDKDIQNSMELSYFGCIIPNNAKHIPEAKQFLRFLSRKENSEEFATITKNISARIDVPAPKELIDVDKYTNKAQVYYKSAEEISIDSMHWWSQIFLALNRKLITNELTPSEFIKEMETQTKNASQRGR